MRTVRVGATGWLLVATTFVGQSLSQVNPRPVGPAAVFDPTAAAVADFGHGPVSHQRVVDFSAGAPDAPGTAGLARVSDAYPPPMVPPPPAAGLHGGGPFLPQWGGGSEYAQHVPRYSLYARGHWGDGLGYKDGFQTYGVFAPLWEPNPHNLFFTDSALLITHDTHLGVNTSLGYRRLIRDKAILGGSVWFDTDVKEERTRYDQVAVNAELLTEYFDIYANGYMPVGSTDEPLGTVFGTDPFYEGNRIVFRNLLVQTSALTGGDITVGIPVPGQPWLKNYLGTYFYNPEFDEPVEWGFRYRLAARLDESTTVEMRVTDDDLFGTNVVLAVEYAIGEGWKPFRPFRQRAMCQRMYEKPFRFNRIVSQKVAQTVSTPAINPETGQPYFVTHVNNTSPPGGTGTFEQPFNTLTAAENPIADLILVRTGSSSAANPIPAGIRLFDNQRLLGEGEPHFFVAAGRGTFLLPNFATTGSSPFITAPANVNAITLASGNEVSAFNIIAPSGAAGIGTPATPIRDFTINTINQDFAAGASTGPGTGIALTNATGTGTIQDAQFTYPLLTGGSGIVVQNTAAAPLNLALRNVSVQGGDTGLRLLADNAQITASASNVRLQQNIFGAVLTAQNNGTIAADIADSLIAGSQNDGLTYVVNGGTIRGTAINSNITDSGQSGNGNGVRVIGQGTVDLTFQTANITGSASEGILFNMSDAGGPTVLDFLIRNSTILNNGPPANPLAASGVFSGPGTTARLTFQDVVRQPVFLDPENGAQVFFNGNLVPPSGQTFE